jgi:coniferyl-aldehyde dehydrogenase
MTACFADEGGALGQSAFVRSKGRTRLDTRSGERTIEMLGASFGRLRDASRREVAVDAATRKHRLRRLLQLVDDRTEDFAEAISADFGHRSIHETRLAEALVVESAIKFALRSLDHWMRPKAIRTGWQFWPGSNRLIAQPLGVVGIIAPWNYPLQLTLAPLVGALAAGNRAMIKPSELVPRFSALLSRAIADRFDAGELTVVEGGPEISHALAALPFDHLVFTGSTRVGRLIAETAASNLTPLTLELGGKSPTIIDRSADIGEAARRIAFGKLLNAGQTCIAPDYVLCPRGREGAFADAFFSATTTLYGKDLANDDYTAIITPSHYDRLAGLLNDAANKGGRIEIHTGSVAEGKASRKFPPALILSTTQEMLVRQEEIFGPVLPIIPYDETDDAIAHVNRGERPLALYWFGTDARARDKVLNHTVSGGVTVNDCLLHIAQERQPFGGVGASGMGCYHGEWGFRRMSKEKPVFLQARRSGTSLLQPPYGPTFDRIMALLRRFA